MNNSLKTIIDEFSDDIWITILELYLNGDLDALRRYLKDVLKLSDEEIDEILILIQQETNEEHKKKLERLKRNKVFFFDKSAGHDGIQAGE